MSPVRGTFEPIGPAPPVAALEPDAPPLAILVDYDGTIALNDVSDQIMAEHVPGDWEAEAAKYDAGGMGSRPPSADPGGEGRDPVPPMHRCRPW